MFGGGDSYETDLGIYTRKNNTILGITCGTKTHDLWNFNDHIPHIIAVKSQIMYADGSEVGRGNTDHSSNNHLYIFRHSTSNIPAISYKVYYVKIWDENMNLLRDMIPSINQNIPCMYDKISNKFFYNQGTGNFIYQ